jgi:hypothetical protein
MNSTLLVELTGVVEQVHIKIILAPVILSLDKLRRVPSSSITNLVKEFFNSQKPTQEGTLISRSITMEHRSKTKPKKLIVECLYCSEDIYIGGNPKIGSLLECKNCESQFEIIELEPIMIDWMAYDEDFGEDDDLYDYE